MPLTTGKPGLHLEDACRQLCQSERGRLALNDLFHLLQNGATGLDQDNKQAIFCLLVCAFQGQTKATLETIGRALR